MNHPPASSGCDHDHGLHDGHGHHHGHGHGHHHHHHHHAPAPGHSRAFAIAVLLNAGFVVVEVGASFASGSSALLADAGHNFGDVLSLALAWGAGALARRPARAGFTYGLKGSSIFAAIANVALLWMALGAVLAETIEHIFVPAPIAPRVMMLVAGAGIAINLGSALLFARGREHDLNLRAAFAHLLADALVAAGVVVAGAAITLTGWRWIDPLASLAITLVLGWGSWGLVKEAARMALAGVPGHINEGAVGAFLAQQPGVAAVHDLHIWPMSTTETAFTAHLVMPDGHPGDGFLQGLAHELEQRFAIHHPTIQIESGGGDCRLEAVH